MVHDWEKHRDRRFSTTTHVSHMRDMWKCKWRLRDLDHHKYTTLLYSVQTRRTITISFSVLRYCQKYFFDRYFKENLRNDFMQNIKPKSDAPAVWSFGKKQDQSCEEFKRVVNQIWFALDIIFRQNKLDSRRAQKEF